MHICGTNYFSVRLIMKCSREFSIMNLVSEIAQDAQKRKGMMSVSEHPPSQRYLNMLTSGGRKMKLDDAYVAALEAHPVSSLPSLAEYLTPAVKEAIASKRFTMDEIERSAQEEGAAKLMVLKGVVFTCHPHIKRDFGKDVTLFECLRVRVIDSLDEIGDDHKEDRGRPNPKSSKSIADDLKHLST